MPAQVRQGYTVMFGRVWQHSWKYKLEQAALFPWMLMMIVGVPLVLMTIQIAVGVLLAAAHTPLSVVIFILFLWYALHDGSPCMIYGFMLEIFREAMFKTQAGHCIDAAIEAWIADPAAQTPLGVPIAKGLNWLCSETPHKTDCVLQTMGHLLTIAVPAFAVGWVVGPHLWRLLWGPL